MKLVPAALSRRRVLALLSLAPAGLAPGGLLMPAAAAPLAAITVHRDPSCGCCGAWVEHLRREGFDATIVETSALDAVKRRLGVPAELASCHTAEVQGYVVEGHVPASAIRKLLAERPQAAGLAVPGMPIGSPGMEGPRTEPLVTYTFGGSGEPQVFAVE
jgi:hypothetical protein